MKLRQFTHEGIERFRDMLHVCRTNPTAKVDYQLLEDKKLTLEVPNGADVNEQIFETKGDAGKYIHALISSTGLAQDDVILNVGLWSWLSLFFFDSVCPKNKNGGRRVKSDYTYIYKSQHMYHYGHLLFVSWRAWDTVPNNKPHRLITSTRIDELDRVTREIMKRISLFRIPCIFEVLDRIYWNTKTERVRKNITSETRAGNITIRLPSVIK
jgi:hypothetical protein